MITKNVTDIVDDYAKYRVLRPSTIRMLKMSAYTLESFCGKKSIGQYTEDNLAAWRDNLIQNQKSPFSINSYITNIRLLLKFAYQKGLISKLPVINKVPRPRIPKKTLSDEVVKDIVRLLVDTPPNTYSYLANRTWFWKPIVLTFYYTGMRLSEVSSLKWEDVHNLEQESKALFFVRAQVTKTKRFREIPIHTALQETLLAFRTEMEKRRAVLPTNLIFDVSVIFPNVSSDPKKVGEKITILFKTLTDILKVPISAHRFRHTLASRIVNDLKDLKTAQAVLGHTSITTTMGYVADDVDGMRATLNRIP